MNREEYLMEVIRKPISTEKKYGSCFVIHSNATKQDVKEAIEKVFSVNVVKVTVSNQKPKKLRNGSTKAKKTAYVRLAEGQMFRFGTDTKDNS